MKLIRWFVVIVKFETLCFHSEFFFLILQKLMIYLILIFILYLGQSKSSENDTLISYKKRKETFSLYILIEKRMLYFSILFDHTSAKIIRIKFQ
jgi:hypothetical protein